MLKIENLSFRYNKKSNLVLDNVSLELEKGQIGIVLGKNGSGKSTLFKNILGILKPLSGTVSIDGENILKMNRRVRATKIAYVPQDITFGSLTVYDTILLGRVSRFGLVSTDDDKEIVDSIIEEMGLEANAFRNVNELSGGERQKVAIARALAQEPEMLVFDEPTGNLDIGNEQLILKEAKRLAKEKGITIIVAIHDINTALSFGDKFFLLKKGTLVNQGGEEIITPEHINCIFDVNVKVEHINGRKIVILEDDYEKD